MAAGLVFTLLLGLSFGLWDGADAGCRLRDATSSVCPEGWTWYDGRCFKFFETRKTWDAAEFHCLSFKGNLVSIHSGNQYNFIRNLVHNVSGKDTESWIGGHDTTQERYFFWTDGSKFVFNSWGVHEPNHAVSNEDCMEINFLERDYVNDERCNKELPYICASVP
ncbi:galactose-specific lectin nattectin-like [Xiphophorus couchianus]|uniref:galactose-specific lectin nattectin-like n=1 Tax=Xiphophorus couchianus TaxID=32473 RepID=UPI00101717DE|nr:galactose-specific lectin nattectin-like [Xiphophorus couchianus]